MTEDELNKAYGQWYSKKQEESSRLKSELPDGLEKYLEGVVNSGLSAEFSEHLRLGRNPSEFIAEKMPELFNGYIRPDFRPMVMWTADNVRSWQYSDSIYRRSYRSSDFSEYYTLIQNMIIQYSKYSFYESSPSDFVVGKLSALEERYRSFYYSGSCEWMLAYLLDNDEESVLEGLENIINGDEGTVDTGLIRGIIRSKNPKAHEMLGRLLVAARLQEGVRQAICENADCGTPEAFKHILKVIIDNDLIRFSAVKRAVWTWCGIYTDDTESIDRISSKLIKLMDQCINYRAAAENYFSSEDAIELYVALWSIGFCDIVECTEICKKLIAEGTHHQRLVIGVFVSSLSQSRIHEAAKLAVRLYSSEPDTMAAFTSKLMNFAGPYVRESARKMLPEAYYYRKDDPRSTERVIPPVDIFFKDREEAYEYYNILKNALSLVPKKLIEFKPFVFPWYWVNLQKSELAARMTYIACALDDDSLRDEVCPMLTDIDGDERADYLVMLTSFPATPLQQKTAVAAIADKESFTRGKAAKLAEHLELTDDNYKQLEDMLRFKSADVRTTVISMLFRLDDTRLSDVCERLISDKKSEKRLAGLDIILKIKQSERKELFEKIIPLVSALDRSVSKEEILIKEILSGNDSEKEKESLYDNTPEKLPEINADFISECDKLFAEIFPGKVSDDYVKALDELYEAVSRRFEEEVTVFGEKRLFENISYVPRNEKFPFKEDWDSLYENSIKTPQLLIRMKISRLYFPDEDKNSAFAVQSKKIVDALFGEELKSKSYPRGNNAFINVMEYLYRTYVDHDYALKIGASVINKLLAYDKSEIICETEEKRSYGGTTKYTFTVDSTPQLGLLSETLFTKNNDSLFRNVFPIRLAYSAFMNHKRYDYYHGSKISSTGRVPVIDTNELIRACALGIISENEMYRLMFEHNNLGSLLAQLSSDIKFIRERDRVVSAGRRHFYAHSDGEGLIGCKTDSEFTEDDRLVLEKAREVYEKVISLVLNTELNRGDSETEYSAYISKIERIYGIENYVKLLAALGKDSFVRGYMYGSASSKNECMSHLINVCIPEEGDNAEKLRELVSKTDITEQRLIEAAMYSPEWIDITGEYLGWDGFKCGCYYFMAHMNDRFDEKRKAVTARFTPVSVEELQNGAFDISWFSQAHEMLGEKRFSQLYDAAKYISDGAKHSRARKYADAVLDKLDSESTKQQIIDKRNKDLLMAYSLIPFRSDDELLDRYLYLQQFLKESKKFGAQRRASEAQAVEISMKNLSISAGFSDVTRLKLRMEGRLFENIREQFEPKQVDNISVWLEINSGKTELKIEKDGKAQKSVPAKLKKNEYILALNETKKQLNEQYSRTKLMFEQAMEDSAEFTLGEMLQLNLNPVALSVTKDLVFISENGKSGVIKDNKLTDADGNIVSDDTACVIRAAHPFDLYIEGSWRSWQKYLFENRTVQPFRQVFRELYVKTDEESETSMSRRYAGNQILVKKTVAALKSRRWVCDVEDGLQKVYFKENIIARLYALADWFSPSDIEAPTIEYVSFEDRMTGKPVLIKDIPDIVFSEVMRDCDLAVSVCHAGGVDPEHSHSTVEMRTAVLEFTLPLFRLSNCEIKGAHVFIKGTRADYNVHIGSGVCHISGGAMLNILPVHSQQKGRIFLPFADDDPKTAEVISKILLLADDKKIKDPYILSQISNS